MNTRYHSIRWLLPVSYAAVALLTALALGVFVLTSLGIYYSQREQAFLAANARFIRQNLSELMTQGVAVEVLAEQARALSFLSQMRIRVLDPDRNLMADTGVPFGAYLEVIVGEGTGLPPGQSPEKAPGETGNQYTAYIQVHRLPEPPPGLTLAPEPLEPPGAHQVTQMPWERPQWDRLALRPERPVVIDLDGPLFASSGIPAVGTLFGFDLGAGSLAPVGRSKQRGIYPLAAGEGGAGQLLGYVEISAGPALGREILTAVALAAAAAGLAAVLAGGVVGWLFRRRISQPVLDLTAVTGRMAAGDLAARAAETGPAELGLLAGAFNRMAQRVEEMVTSLRRFVADAAHELNTPLTTLRVAIEYLAPQLATDPQRRMLDRALAQITHLERLSNGLLSLSHVEGGLTEKPHTMVDLSELLRSLEETFASRAEQAGLYFELRMPEAVSIPGDRQQLTSAVGNLLDNAIKFTPAGGYVRVTVEERATRVIVTVEDSGIGIPPDDLPLIFERFHRAGNTAAYPGSGLGLALVDAVVRRHRGAVQVANNTPAPGIQVSLSLPKSL